ncbi:hypothetical protein D3C85_956280 [compost metagenome]
MVLPGPGLQGARQSRFEQACGFHQLLPGVANAAAQIAQLQTTLQGELPGHDRGLPDRCEATDALDQVRSVLGGDLGQQVRFQPRRQCQAIVHGDLFAQRLQGSQGVGETVVAIRPPTDAAQAFRVEAVEGGLQGLIACQGFILGFVFLQRCAEV